MRSYASIVLSCSLRHGGQNGSDGVPCLSDSGARRAVRTGARAATAPPSEEASVREYFEFVSRTWVLSATLATVLILVLAVFPALPVGGEMLDVKAGYTYPEVVAAMASYGEQGRTVYAWSSGILDTLLPVAYVSLLAGLIYRFRPAERLWKLAHLPFVVGTLDLGENLLIIFMLTRYPDVSARQAASASSFTVSRKVCDVGLRGAGGGVGSRCGGPPRPRGLERTPLASTDLGVSWSQKD